MFHKYLALAGLASAIGIGAFDPPARHRYCDMSGEPDASGGPTPEQIAATAATTARADRFKTARAIAQAFADNGATANGQLAECWLALVDVLDNTPIGANTDVSALTARIDKLEAEAVKLEADAAARKVG